MKEYITKIMNLIQKRDVLFLIVFLLFLSSIFYFGVFFRGEVITSSDFIFMWEPWKTLKPEGFLASNYVLSDAASTLYPLLQNIYSDIRDGVFPLWYSNTGLGSSTGFLFLSNMALHPFLFIPIALTAFSNLPFSLNVSSILALLFRGVFTYLLLRKYKLRKEAALLASVVSSFALYGSVWTVSSLSLVSSAIPFLFWTIERVFEKTSKNNLLIFTLSVFMLVMGGFPSTIAYVMYFAGFFVLVRLLYLKLNKVYSWKDLFIKFSIFLAGGLLAFGLTSFTLLPTADNLLSKVDLSYRVASHSRRFLDEPYIYRILVPEYLGNPIDYTWQQAPYQPINSTNYNESAIYVGILPLIFIAFTLFDIKKNRKVQFYWFSGILTFFVIYKIGPFLDIVNKLPIFDTNPNTRMLVLLNFILVILVGFGFNKLLEMTEKKKELPGYFLPGLFILFVNLLGLVLYRIIRFRWGLEGIETRVLLQIGIAFGLLVNSVALIHARIKKYISVFVFVAISVLVVFLDLYYFGHDYTPTINKSDFYPTTPGIEYLIENTGNNRILPFDEIFLFGGQAYYDLSSLNLVTHYDSTWKDFINILQPGSTSSRKVSVRHKRSEIDLYSQLLDVTGTKFIVDHGASEDLQNKTVLDIPDFNNQVVLERQDNISQSFRLFEDAVVDEIILRPSNLNLSDDDKFAIEIRENDSGIILSTNVTNASEVKLGELLRVSTNVSLQADEEYYLTLKLLSGDGYIAFNTADVDIYLDGELTKNGNLEDKDLTLSLVDYDERIFEKYKEVYKGEVRIYENTEVMDKGFLVHKVVNVPWNRTNLYKESIQALTKLVENKELLNTAVVAGTEIGLDDCKNITNDTVEVVYYGPNRIELNTTSECDSVLVVGDQYDDAWNVYVDGEKKQALRVNHVMRGVYLEKGSHKVDFKYENKVIQYSLGLSILSLFVTIMVAVLPVENIISRKNAKRASKG